jgi:uncharacterized protein
MTEYQGPEPRPGGPAPEGRGPAPQGSSTAAAGGSSVAATDDAAEYEAWRNRHRVVLTPIAAPSVLGLFGFAAATFLVASNLAGWWGNSVVSPLLLAPLVIFLGGVAQIAAAMWAYRARDAVATAMHGTWGAFWLAWGVTQLMVAGGLLPFGTTSTPAFGFWWIVAAVVTIFGALAALGRNMGMFVTLGLLAAGSALQAAGILGATHSVVVAGGWVLVASAAAAFYTAGAMMLEEAFGGRVILPLGRWSLRGNVPGYRATRPIGYAAGMPGLRAGQ